MENEVSFSSKGMFAVSDLVTAAARIHRLYDSGGPVLTPFTHEAFDKHTGESIGTILIHCYQEGAFHVWMVPGYVVYTRTMFNSAA